MTDAHDRRLLMCLLENFYNKDVVHNEDYKFSPSRIYYAPRNGPIDAYADYIKRLPKVITKAAVQLITLTLLLL